MNSKHNLTIGLAWNIIVISIIIINIVYEASSWNAGSEMGGMNSVVLYVTSMNRSLRARRVEMLYFQVEPK